MTTRSDDFNRANSTSPGSDWSEDSGDWQINSNTVYNYTTGSSYRKLRWIGAAMDSNDYSVKIVGRGPTNGHGIGPAARLTADSTVTYYALIIFGGYGAYLVYIDAGAESVLASSSGFTANTSTMRPLVGVQS